MARSVFRVLVIGLMTVIGLGSLPALAGVVVSAVRILSTREIADEDDMCFWLHPTDLSRSTVISSDKKARSLFVYDLEGHLLQAIASPEPGNVDVRYDFPLGGREVDIVAFNDRETQRIRVYAVDPATRLLSRVDDDGISTGKNYGFTLYRSATSGRTYAFTGPKAETVVQEWELVDDGTGRVAGIGPFRHLRPGGVCEGMVSDDETGKLYVSQEAGGVWKYDAEPTASDAGSAFGIAACRLVQYSMLSRPGMGGIAADHGEREIERRGARERGAGTQHARDQPGDECAPRPRPHHLMIPTGMIFTTSDVLPQKRSRAR